MKSKAECTRITEEKKAGKSEESYFEEFEKFEEVKDKVFDQKQMIRDTMFASHFSQEIKNELSKCLRVMPHHQNTSGFFITIIQKVKEFDTAKLTEADPKPDEKLPLKI